MGASRARPCMASMKAAYALSVPAHARPSQARVLATAKTSERGTRLAPGRAAWAEREGFGMGCCLFWFWMGFFEGWW
jgi:hypothetical protein